MLQTDCGHESGYAGALFTFKIMKESFEEEHQTAQRTCMDAWS